MAPARLGVGLQLTIFNAKHITHFGAGKRIVQATIHLQAQLKNAER
jgi:hypothetical protein